MQNIAGQLTNSEHLNEIYTPVILRLSEPADKQVFKDLTKNNIASFGCSWLPY